MSIDWHSYFYYDEGSLSGLSRARDWVSGRNGHIIKARKGDPCLSLNSNGYYEVYCEGKLYKSHRIIWEMFNGPIPDGMTIDHIDGCKTCNKISNLRCVTQAINNRNKSIMKSNKSGIVGVYQQIRKGVPTHWIAKCCHNGEVKRATFSITKYGYEEAFKMAREYRETFLGEVNADGAGFTDRNKIMDQNRITHPYTNLPQWPYENVQNLLERVYEVESWFNFWGNPQMRVVVKGELFEYIRSHSDVKQLYTYFSSGGCKTVDLAPGKRWIKISRTLFVVEE